MLVGMRWSAGKPIAEDARLTLFAAVAHSALGKAEIVVWLSTGVWLVVGVKLARASGW